MYYLLALMVPLVLMLTTMVLLLCRSRRRCTAYWH